MRQTKYLTIKKYGKYDGKYAANRNDVIDILMYLLAWKVHGIIFEQNVFVLYIYICIHYTK